MQMVLDVAHKSAGSLRLSGVPLNLSGTPATPGGAPPDLGEHTDSILKDELGLNDDRIAALRKEGTI
jgi:formyl-CoA transferase